MKGITFFDALLHFFVGGHNSLRFFQVHAVSLFHPFRSDLIMEEV